MAAKMAEPQSEAPALERDAAEADALTTGAHHGRWAGLVVLAFLGVLGAIDWTILRDLVRQWWDDANYSHGFLVPLFSGWVVWRRRKQLAARR